MEERIAERDDEIEGFEELSAEEKVAIGKWFLLKSPPGQIRQVAKGAVFGSLPPLLTAFLAALFFLVVCSSLMSDAYLSRNSSSQRQAPTKLHHKASYITQFSSEELDPFQRQALLLASIHFIPTRKTRNEKEIQFTKVKKGFFLQMVQESEFNDEEVFNKKKSCCLIAGDVHLLWDFDSDVRTVLMDDSLFTKAAEEAFPEYNVKHMIPVELPDHSGKVLVTKYAEVDNSHYLDPRTAVVATIDHIKQVCTSMRPAADEELPTALVEEYRVGVAYENKIRIAVDAELLKYVEEAYPGGECAVYCTCGKNVDKHEGEIELAAVISNASFSSKNFRGGSWRSVWRIQINEELHAAELQGQINVNAHYFEEGNVQLDTSYECHDSIQFQDAGDMGAGIVNVVERLESEYLSSLEDSYAKLSDRTFKELRRKLPVTRTLFSWDKALQLSLSRDLAREFTSKR